MALDLQKFVQRFVGEGRDHLARLADGLGALEARPDDAELVNVLFRSAHTLKGSARMLKLTGICDVAHGLEDLLGAVRDGQRRPDAALVSVLLAGTDAIAAQFDQVEAGVADPPADAALRARLAAALVVASAPVDAPDPAPAPIPAPIPAPTPTPGPAATAAPAPSRAPESVRVPLAKLDELVNLIGEVMAMQGRLRERSRQARRLDRSARALAAAGGDAALAAASGALRRALRDDVQAQELLTAALGERALALRMLPLSMLFDPGARMVRELARGLGKEVRCEVSGGEVELDRQIIEGLGDALVHVLRNAVDHGIESPAARRAAGKPAAGLVRISARAGGGSVEVEVRDDGRGLDRAAILARATQAGLVDAAAAAALPDELVWELVYAPGLSTSDAVTELSGRGVGMDAVRGIIIDTLHGAIDIRSEPGAGSRVSLRVPLSLAVMRLVLFTAAGQTFALAAAHVVALIRVGAGETRLLAGRPAVVLDDEFVPLVPLADLLRLPPAGGGAGWVAPRADGARLAIVIGVRQAKLGLVIDALCDEREMLIKPLPAHLRGGGLVAGIVTTGDQRLVSLLQAPTLLEVARRGHGEGAAWGSGSNGTLFGNGFGNGFGGDSGLGSGVVGGTAAGLAGGRRQTHREPRRVLVVDDSLNTREIVREVLEASGYRVSTAADGLDAWQQAVGGRFDAVLTDVEMPGLDGLALTARLRTHARYQSTPIVILTSRGDDDHKRRGIEAGADAYIVKAAFDQAGLVETLANLLGDGA